ncbi:unnamed protein product, partial [Brenthis ino]
MDCLQGLAKAHDLKMFNFQDFNYEEYVRLDKIQGGDLNWIIPGKFLAFIGPVDYSVALYHPPEIYIEYFLENNVKTVIRLNKRLYDGNVFINVGITHYNLFFPDGSCPPRHILFKFLQISEQSDGAIAVHCKAWLEELESWLIKQGNLYRRRTFQDVDKMPMHEFGIYSFSEKSHNFRPVVISKSPSPPPPMQRPMHSDISKQIRPQASKVREEKSENNKDDIFLASCDLTIEPKEPTIQMKGCVIKNSTTPEEYNSNEDSEDNMPLWKKYLCCKSCKKAGNDKLWWLAVRCAKIAPKRCQSNKCCMFLDLNVLMKSTISNKEIEKHLCSSITIKPQHTFKVSNNFSDRITSTNITKTMPSVFSSGPRDTLQPQQRRRLGRSPSPPPIRTLEQSRATNTPSPGEMIHVRDSKSTLRAALSRLQFKNTLKPLEMGALVTKALRPIKSFNIENRAHRVISKEKPDVAPSYPSTIEELKRVHEVDPHIDEKLDKKDPGLDERLKDVYVTSYGRPEDDVTKEKKDQSVNRPLPQSRGLVPDFDFGLKEPDKVPYGKTTLRHAIDYISSYQINPAEVTAAKIAHEYKMKVDDVECILKYFKTYEVYLPATKKTPAMFAGPSELRKQLYKTNVQEIERKKDADDEKEPQKNISQSKAS